MVDERQAFSSLICLSYFIVATRGRRGSSGSSTEGGLAEGMPRGADVSHCQKEVSWSGRGLLDREQLGSALDKKERKERTPRRNGEEGNEEEKEW